METVKRGYVPKDTTEFGPKAADKLNAAAQELAFLLDREIMEESIPEKIHNFYLDIATACENSLQSSKEERYGNHRH